MRSPPCYTPRVRALSVLLAILLLPAAAAADGLADARKALLVKDYDRAESLARAEIPTNPAEARYLLAVALKGQGKLDDAALAFAAAVREPDASTRLRSRALYGNALVQ